MPQLRVAVDIGGTFTDICILDQESGKIRIAKTASTPDPIDGVMTGLETGGVDLADVVLFSHGTTVATNALITRRLPRTAMVCTEGFRDVIEIRRANKDDIWDIYKDVAPPYIPRRDRLTVPERVDAAGKVVTPLDETAAREIARILKKRGVAAVAVCFMNSYINPVHEQRMQAILADALPGIPVSISSAILPEIFEHERFSTTVVNAALSPVVVDYTTRLGTRLADAGYGHDLLLLHTGGGVMTPAGVKEFAGRLAGSGIAAGAIASRHIAAQCGFPNSIGLDMGGTSCDVSLAYEGQSRVTQDWFIEFGYPIRFPSIEVLTIGAGGGSLAWIDEAGGLRNGPQSAGANPGPACYARGNTVPTNTDANVTLGRLGTELAGGSIHLDAEKARAAVQTVADRFHLGLEEAADAIIRVANANMADAVRLISISRGYDPRDFALVAFGGAGALHGADIAKELSIPAVIVPPHPGITSALGCLLKCGDDEGIMPFTSIANVACGFHASDPTVMHKTVRLAKAHGVAVGAHPSLPDLQGFGRREMKIGRDELTDCIIYQVGALKAFLDAEGLPLNHIKPHGALFGIAIRDAAIAEGIANAVALFGVPVLGMAGTLHETVYTGQGLAFIPEHYIDLDYSDEGMLITREHEAKDPEEAARRAVRVAREGMATSISGKPFPIRAESYCIHSDTPNAIALAETVTQALQPWLAA